MAKSGFYGPRVELFYARPTLWWEVWSDQGTVTSAEMDVNGSPVDAHYDPTTRSLTFTPNRPLPPGPIKIHCAVTFNSAFTFNRDWEASISPAAVGQLPVMNDQQKQALKAANEYREQLGLPDFIADDRLDTAAQAHANYMTQNNTRGHGERSNDPGFVGADPGARLEAFGWGGPSWEGLAYLVGDAHEAVRSLFEAPYHRVPFLQPGVQQFGFGINGFNAAAEFQACKEECVSLSPRDGETNVPTSWFSKEMPDPLAIHPEATHDSAVGYPIMLVQFSQRTGKLSINSAVVTDQNGIAITAFVNTPANDQNLTNAIVIIPTAPLKPGMQYKVSVAGTDMNGQPLQKSWSFQTASQPIKD
jgi:uncharacterized protein YkwD